MISVLRYDDVTRLQLSSVGSVAARLHVSAYVYRGVLIDSGFHRARGEVVQALDALDIQGAMITHWHEDHAGNVELLAARGVPLAMHALTQKTLHAAPAIRLYRRLVWGRPPALASKVTAFEHDALRFVPTPGHSPDHQVVWDADRSTLFSGDLWLGVRARVMHASENPYAILQSLRKIAALAPQRMFDAHRGPVSDPVGALRAKVDWMEETIGQIRARVADGWSDRAIRRAVLGGEERSAYVSLGEYARMNFVRAVRRETART
jgi:endoribonuclease LACTB2